MNLELNRIYNEDCRKTIERMEDNSIDCLITSPPYWALRDYGEEAVSIWDSVNGCLHEWGDEIEGKKLRWSDTNIENQKEVFPERVLPGSVYCKKCGAWRGSLGLEPDFNLYIKHLCEIFDIFKPKLKKAGTVWVNLGDTYSGIKIGNTETNKNKRVVTNNFKKEKSEIANKSLCMIPERFAIEMVNRGWILRNEIIWHKPNCMPQSVRDRFTVDFEKIFFFVKSERYWFEQQFEKLRYREIRNKAKENYNKILDEKYISKGKRKWFRDEGRNKRCVWKVITKGDKNSHYAKYPLKILETPIKAGCPKGGIIYDPFMGSGTTAIAAIKLNRNWVGSEINAKYVEMAERRIKNERSKLRLELED